MLCDVTDKASVVALYDAAEKAFGSVDVSIQNAGVITIAKVEDLPKNDWDKVMAVNTKGVFLCAQEAIARMRKHGKGGRIINTASGQARDGFIYTPHYAASKMGVVGITQSLAKEVAIEGITVNALLPRHHRDRHVGPITTRPGEAAGQLRAGRADEGMGRGIPMKRAGSGEDVAGLVTFLASEDAAYITGQTINVDGGLIMSLG